MTDLNPEQVRDPRLDDPDYSPDFQDEYQRLWHKSQARVKELEALLAKRDEQSAALGRGASRKIVDLEVELLAQGEALAAADDLLRRLSEWDMLYVSPEGKPVTGDGPYWQAEIARTRDRLASLSSPTTEEET